MKPMYKTIPLALAASALFTSATQAAVISVNFTNADGPRQILATESTGVVDTTGWVNMQTTTATDVGGTVVDINLSNATDTSNTARDAGGDGTNGFLALFEAGLRDSSSGTPGDSFVTINDMTAFLTAEGATSYTIYAYYKSGVTYADRTLSIGTNSGNLTSVNSPDAANISVNDSFVALGSTDSNYVVYSGLTADSTNIYINRGARDAMLTGIQIVAVPEPSSAALLGLGGLALIFRRRK